MSFPRLRDNSSRSRLALSAAALLLDFTLLSNDSKSCSGGFGEPTVINSRETLLGMPSARFGQEIARIKSPTTTFKSVTSDSNHDKITNTQAELQDFDSFAKFDAKATDRAAHIPRSVIAYVRGSLDSYDTSLEKQPFGSSTKPAAPQVDVDDNLPAEFCEYLKGLVAYKLRDSMVEARSHWEKVLDLPADDRQWRGVWAAYMTGRSFQSEPSKAIPWFIKTRELAADGAHDTLGLAAASYGWQARAELDQKHFDAAIELYLTQLATGNTSAVESLQLTCINALAAGDAALLSLAKNDTSRAVITSFIVATGGPWQKAPADDKVAAWLKAIEAANVPKLDNADRLAWSAYEYGHYDLAARWVARADSDSGVAQWVASKLALRDGKVYEAMKLLASAAEHFPTAVSSTEYDDDRHYYARDIDSVERVRGELGALLLARAKYIDSLDLLVRNGYWIDAAFIAERVLTADELKAYVDRQPVPTTKPTASDNRGPLQSLLARRLLRLGRWKDARPYFDETTRKLMDDYIAAIRAGHDAKQPVVERGRSLWTAAQIARKNGMELLGTELGPDANVFFHGNEPEDYLSDARRKQVYQPLQPSADELTRLARPPEQLNKRYHYRYVAADHAWAAAALLPDNSDELAKVLNTAGNWLKAKDPASADRFYKALATRCRNTALGKQAIALKWLVP